MIMEVDKDPSCIFHLQTLLESSRNRLIISKVKDHYENKFAKTKNFSIKINQKLCLNDHQFWIEPSNFTLRRGLCASSNGGN